MQRTLLMRTRMGISPQTLTLCAPICLYRTVHGSGVIGATPHLTVLRTLSLRGR